MQQVLHIAAFFTIINSNAFMIQFRKKVIKRRGQDIGIILIHELFQIKLVQIRNFKNFK